MDDAFDNINETEQIMPDIKWNWFYKLIRELHALIDNSDLIISHLRVRFQC